MKKAFKFINKIFMRSTENNLLPYSPITLLPSTKKSATRIIRGAGTLPNKRLNIVCERYSDRHLTGWVRLPYRVAHTAPSRKFGFTLAEVLITLAIIGVVAAMTLPSVIEKHQKQTTVAKLKKAYTTLSQMLISSYADNGPVELSGSVNSEETEKFFNTYWLPYFLAPEVANTRFYDLDKPFYGLNKVFINNAIMTDLNSGRILFSTQDGFFYYVNIMYWAEYDDDGNGIPGSQKYAPKQSVWVDINGVKLPNTLGKDVFVFQINFEDNVVKPHGYNLTDSAINSNCSKTGTGRYCAAKIMRDGWQIKDDYPW